MKIRKLHLKAYGPFTTRTLDFSSETEGLHIVYGQNEAGKSSALRALVGLLYGIDERTADSFLHPATQLRIGAELKNAAGEMLHIDRRKGRKNTLLDPVSSQPLSDDVLAPFLGGTSQEQFERFFGINHERLVAGGRGMADGRDSLAENLFSAAMGVAGITKVIENLDEKAGALFKPTGKKAAVNEALSEYRDAEKEIRESSVSGRDWEKLQKTVQLLNKKAIDAKTELSRLQGERSRLQRVKQAIPLIAQRAGLHADLKSIGPVRRIDPSQVEEWRLCEKQLPDVNAALARLNTAIQETESALTAIAVDEVLLMQDKAIAELTERRGSIRKAQHDVIGLRARYAALTSSFTNDLVELWGDAQKYEINTLRIPIPQKDQIKKLIAEHTKLRERLTSAMTHRANSEKKCAELREKLQQMGQAPDLSELRTAFAQAQKADGLETTLREERRKQLFLMNKIASGLKQLAGWTGTVSQLAQFPVPAETTLLRYENDLAACSARIQSLEQRLTELRQKHESDSGKLNELALAGDVPTEKQLYAVRDTRTHGWGIIRRILQQEQPDSHEIDSYRSDKPLHERFESHVAEADDVADRLRREADRVAEKATLEAQCAEFAEKITGLEAEKVSQQTEADRLASEWSGFWVQHGITPLPPQEMRAWLDQRTKLLSLHEEHQGREITVQEFDQRIKSIITRLSTALQQIGGQTALSGEMSLSEFAEVAGDILKRNAEHHAEEQNCRSGLALQEQQYTEAESAFNDVDKALAGWQDQWNAALADVPFAAGADPDAMTLILEAVEAALKKRDEAEQLDLRIVAIENDMTAFQDDVSKCASLVALDEAGLDAVAIVDALGKCLTESRTASERRIQLRENLEKLTAERLNEEQKRGALVGRMQAILAAAGCQEAAEMPTAIDRSRRAGELESEITSLNMQIQQHAHQQQAEAFVEEASAINADQLPTLLEDIARQIEALQESLSLHNQEIGSLNAEINRMDGSSRAAEAAEKAQSCLARMREGAEQYLRLKLAREILRVEVQRYRDKNQSPMLALASEYFSMLTSASFQRLDTAYTEKDVPYIVGVRNRGGVREEVGVSGMSDGTCDQLYLALRLASVDRAVSGVAEPMPFIVDDILVNFDDERSSACLKVLAKFSEKMQVIFFTHHRHIVEIAKQVIPETKLFVQDLQDS